MVNPEASHTLLSVTSSEAGIKPLWASWYTAYIPSVTQHFKHHHSLKHKKISRMNTCTVSFCTGLLSILRNQNISISHPKLAANNFFFIYNLCDVISGTTERNHQYPWKPFCSSTNELLKTGVTNMLLKVANTPTVPEGPPQGQQHFLQPKLSTGKSWLGDQKGRKQWGRDQALWALSSASSLVSFRSVSVCIQHYRTAEEAKLWPVMWYSHYWWTLLKVSHRLRP